MNLWRVFLGLCPFLHSTVILHTSMMNEQKKKQ